LYEKGMIEAVLEATPDIMIILNKDGAVWYCTERVRGMGWTAAELLGMPFEVLFPEPVREATLRAVAEELRTRGLAEITVPIERRGMTPVNMSTRWIEFKGMDGTEGAVVLISGTPAAAMTSEYLAIFRHLLSSTSMDEFLGKVLDEVSSLAIDAVTTYSYSRDIDQFSVIHSWVRDKQVSRAGLIIPPNYTHLGGVVSSGQPVVRQSLEEEKNLFPIDSLHMEDGVRADAAYPLIVERSVQGAVTFGSFQSDVFTPALRNTMELLADVISAFLEKEVRDARVKARSESYRVLAERARYPMATLRTGGEIAFINPAASALVGIEHGSLFDVLEGDSRQAVFDVLEAAARDGSGSAEIPFGGADYRLEATTSENGEAFHLVWYDISMERGLADLADTIGSMPTPVMLVDDAGAVTSWSTPAGEIFGVSEGSVLADLSKALAPLLAEDGAGMAEFSHEGKQYVVRAGRTASGRILTFTDTTDFEVRIEKTRSEVMSLIRDRDALTRSGLALVVAHEEEVVMWPESATDLTGVDGMGRRLSEALGLDRKVLRDFVKEGRFSTVAEFDVGSQKVPVQITSFRTGKDVTAVLLDHTPERELQKKLKEYAGDLEREIESLRSTGERERAEATGTIEESVQRLTGMKDILGAVQDALVDVVYIRDSKGNIHYMTPSGMRMLGVEDTPISALTFIAEEEDRVAKMLLTDRPASDETPAFITVKTPDGDRMLEVFESVVADPVVEGLKKQGMSPAGTVLIGVARDVTRRIEMERQIEGYTAKLEARANETETSLSSQMDSMGSFQELTLRLVAASDTGEAGDSLVDWTTQWLGKGPLALYMMNPDTKRFDLTAHSALPKGAADKYSVLHPDVLNAKTLRGSRSTVTMAPEEGLDIADGELTLVPIFSGKELIAVLVTTGVPPEGVLLTAVKTNVGIFFNRLMGTEELDSRTGVLRAVMSLEKTAIASAEADDILITSLGRLVELCNCDAAVLVVEDGTPTVYGVYPEGSLDIETGTEVDMPVAQLTELVNLGQLMVVDLAADGTPTEFETALQATGVRHIMVMPVMTGEDLTGSIYLCRKGEDIFTRNERATALDLSDIASIAVDRGFTYGKVAALTQENEVLGTLYDGVTDASEDGVYVAVNGIFTRVNGKMADMLGRKVDALIGSDVTEIIADEDRDRVREAMTTAGGEDGTGAAFMVTGLLEDGKDIPLRMTFTSAVHEDGPAVTGFVRDISQSVVAEVEIEAARAAQRSAETDYGRILNGILDAVLVHSVTDEGAPGNIVEANEGAVSLFGHPAGKLKGMTLADLMSDEGRADMPGIMGDLLKNGSIEYSMEVSRDDGGAVPVAIRSVLHDVDGVHTVITTMRDLTSDRSAEAEIERTLGRKVAELESALEKRETGFDHLIGIALDPILTIDTSGKITAANAAASILTARPAEEIIGKRLGQIAVEDDRTSVSEAIGRAAKGESRELPLRIERSSGAPGHTWAKLTPAAPDNDDILVFLRDVTDWTGKGDDLKSEIDGLRTKIGELNSTIGGHERSMAHNEEIIESLEELYLKVSKERRIIHANGSFLDATGFTAADVEGTMWHDIVPVVKKGEADTELGSSDTFEFPILMKSGGDLQITWRVVRGPEAMHLIGSPVKERIAAPAEPGTVRFRMSTGGELEELTGDTERLLGYGSDEAMGIPYFLTKIVHPEDAEQLKVKLLKLIKFKEFEPKDEYRILRKDGKTVYLSEHLEAIYDGAGKLIGVHGDLTDATGDRAEWDNLSGRINFLKSVIDSLPGMGVVVIDVDRTVLHMSSRASTMLGAPEEAIIGSPVERLVTEKREMIETMKDALREGRAAAKMTAAMSEGRNRFIMNVSPRRVNNQIKGYIMTVSPMV